MNFEKQYTNIEYSNKAAEANKNGEKLYVLVKEQEYKVDVPEFETVQEEQQQVKTDEFGLPVVDNYGNPIFETIIVDVEKPVMVDKEVPIYDESGNQTGSTIIQVQKTHTEIRTKKIGELLISPENYYKCYEKNYTYGEINENYEKEKSEKERQRLDLLNLTKADVLLALYADKALTPDDIKAMLKDNVPALIKFDYASLYYRGDEVVNTLGLALGYSTEEMDYLFENKKFPEKPVEPADPDSDADNDNDSDSDTDTDTSTDVETDNEESEVAE